MTVTHNHESNTEFIGNTEIFSRLLVTKKCVLLCKIELEL